MRREASCLPVLQGGACLIRQPLQWQLSRQVSQACSHPSRCCSLDAEDPPALCQNWQPVDSCQKEGPSEGPCAALLQSLDEYLASVEFPEQSTEQQPSLYSDSHAQPGGNHSWMHSNEHDGLLSLLSQKDSQPIPSGMLPLLPQKDGEPVSYGSAADEALLQAAAALGPCKQASAEQQARSSEAECTEGVPLAGIHTLDGCAEEVSLGSASHMLEDIFMQAASSDSSADCFSAEPGQQPFGAVSSALQEAPPSLAIPGRKRGRPRRYDTTLPLGEYTVMRTAPCHAHTCITEELLGKADALAGTSGGSSSMLRASSRNMPLQFWQPCSVT